MANTSNKNKNIKIDNEGHWCAFHDGDGLPTGLFGPIVHYASESSKRSKRETYEISVPKFD